MYNDQADSINVDDISSDRNNRIVLRRLQRNNANDYNNKSLWIQNNGHDDDGEDCSDYCPEGAYDMGWVGYFVGKNEHLRELQIMIPNIPSSGASVRDVMEPFLRGVSHNKSIRQIGVFYMDLLGGEMFTMLGLEN